MVVPVRTAMTVAECRSGLRSCGQSLVVDSPCPGAGRPGFVLWMTKSTNVSDVRLQED